MTKKDTSRPRKIRTSSHQSHLDGWDDRPSTFDRYTIPSVRETVKPTEPATPLAQRTEGNDDIHLYPDTETNNTIQDTIDTTEERDGTMNDEVISILFKETGPFDEGDRVRLVAKTSAGIQTAVYSWKRTQGPLTYMEGANSSTLTIIIPEFDPSEKTLSFSVSVDDVEGTTHETDISVPLSYQTVVGYIALVEFMAGRIWFCLVEGNGSDTTQAQEWVEIENVRAWFCAPETMVDAAQVLLWCQQVRLPVRIRYSRLDARHCVPNDSYEAVKLRIIRDDGHYQ